MPILPLDVVETVVNFLASDDHNLSSTKACSLVCHDFLVICRKSIFASVTLDNWYLNHPHSPCKGVRCVPRTNIAMLHQILSASPKIGDYIRTLNYCIAEDDLPNPTLVEAFEKITRPRYLNILISPRGRRNFWCDDPLRPALLYLLHLPSLTKLRLSGINNFLLMDLTPCVNLKDFGFEDLSALTTSPSKLPDSTSVRLRTLSIGLRAASTTTQMCSALRTDGKPFFDFTDLTNVIIKATHSDEFEASLKLFSRCNSLLEVQLYALHASLSLVGLSRALDPSLQTLKCLDVSTIFADQEGDDDPLRGLANELEKMGSRNVIEDLIMEIHIEMDSTCTTGDAWGRLDKVFAQSGWPELRRVALNIIVGSYDREDNLEEELEKLPETQLPWLSSTKSLVFDFKVGSEWVVL